MLKLFFFYIFHFVIIPIANPSAENSPIFAITPTFRRQVQAAELIRTGNTFRHVNNLLWIVVEESFSLTSSVTEVLKRTKTPFVQLIASDYTGLKGKKKARGVANRNQGMMWLKAHLEHDLTFWNRPMVVCFSQVNNVYTSVSNCSSEMIFSTNKNGVVYFADDDNSYDVALFDEMRTTKEVSMWPVGLVAKFGVSSPVVQHGKVIGFFDGWEANRTFPIDMAGFSVNAEFLFSKKSYKMPFLVGREEDMFLKQLYPFKIEPKADMCRKIMVWHTQTVKRPKVEMWNHEIWNRKVKNTNLKHLKLLLIFD